MTFGSGIAIAGMWASIAVITVYSPIVAVAAVLFVYHATCVIGLRS